MRVTDLWNTKATPTISFELFPARNAEAAEKLGKNSLALENYKKAVHIEDTYRRQFKVMYPDREIFSRLGQENYDRAKQRITALQSD